MSLPITIESTSPLVNYSSSGSNDWVPWNDDDGRRYRVATKNSSSLTLEFYGTGVTIQGRSTSAYQVQLDAAEPLMYQSLQPEDRILYSAKNLSVNMHRVVLTSRANASEQQQLVGFYQAVVESPEHPSDFEMFFDNKNTSVFTYTGQWSLQSTQGVPNDTTTSLYRTTTENGASVSFSFTQSKTVLIRGMLDEDSGMYSVEMEGITLSFNGSHSKLVPDALLFYRGGLNPQSSYTLVLTNNGPGQKRFSLNSVVLHQANSVVTATPESHSSKPAHKTAIIAASITGAALILLAAFYYFYRRRRTSLSNKGNVASQRKPQSHKMVTPHSGSARHLSAPTISSAPSSTLHLSDLPPSSASDSLHDSGPSPASASFLTEREPLREASEPLSPLSPLPPRRWSSLPSTQYSYRDGRTTMTWSQVDDPFTSYSELPSPTQNSVSGSVIHSSSGWEDEGKTSDKTSQQGSTTPSTPMSRKPRPLPSVPSSSATTTEEHDAGVYNENTFLRLLSARSTSGVQPDPLAPPPRYERRSSGS